MELEVSTICTSGAKKYRGAWKQSSFARDSSLGSLRQNTFSEWSKATAQIIGIVGFNLENLDDKDDWTQALDERIETMRPRLRRLEGDNPIDPWTLQLFLVCFSQVLAVPILLALDIWPIQANGNQSRSKGAIADPQFG